MNRAAELFRIAIDVMESESRPIEIHGGSYGTREYEHMVYLIRSDGSRVAIWCYYTPVFSYPYEFRRSTEF